MGSDGFSNRATIKFYSGLLSSDLDSKNVLSKDLLGPGKICEDFLSAMGAKRKSAGDSRKEKEKLLKSASSDKVDENPHIPQLVAWCLDC